MISNGEFLRNIHFEILHLSKCDKLHISHIILSSLRFDSLRGNQIEIFNISLDRNEIYLLGYRVIIGENILNDDFLIGIKALI
tara:strand:+ start:3608 stop:3856 length:249 start_codon:yes stop_codon:yes gene_type:complete